MASAPLLQSARTCLRVVCRPARITSPRRAVLCDVRALIARIVLIKQITMVLLLELLTRQWIRVQWVCGDWLKALLAAGMHVNRLICLRIAKIRAFLLALRVCGRVLARRLSRGVQDFSCSALSQQTTKLLRRACSVPMAISHSTKTQLRR